MTIKTMITFCITKNWWQLYIAEICKIIEIIELLFAKNFGYQSHTFARLRDWNSSLYIRHFPNKRPHENDMFHESLILFLEKDAHIQIKNSMQQQWHRREQLPLTTSTLVERQWERNPRRRSCAHANGSTASEPINFHVSCFSNQEFSTSWQLEFDESGSESFSSWNKYEKRRLSIYRYNFEYRSNAKLPIGVVKVLGLKSRNILPYTSCKYTHKLKKQKHSANRVHYGTTTVFIFLHSQLAKHFGDKGDKHIQALKVKCQFPITSSFA